VNELRLDEAISAARPSLRPAFLTLRTAAASGKRRLHATWQLDGRIWCAEAPWTDALRLKEREALDHNLPAPQRQAALRSLGAALGERLLSEEVENLLAQAPREVLVAGEAESLGLPLEALSTRAGTHLLLGGHALVRRHGRRGSEGGSDGRGLPAERLRVLVLAAAPDEAVPLDHEREEELVLGALEPLRDSGQLEVVVAEGGTREALRAGLERVRPDVVYLSCHGYVDPHRGGYLVLEDDVGFTDRVYADELNELLRLAPPRLLFLSACHGGEVESLAPALGEAAGEVLAYRGPVLDRAATELARALFGALSRGLPVSVAAAEARRVCAEEAQEPDWSLLVHYGPGGAAPLVAPREADSAVAPASPLTLEGFVGRRRELRRLRLLRRQGTGVFWISGPGGIGKSALARRAARERAEDAKLIESTEPLEPGKLALLLKQHLLTHEERERAAAILAEVLAKDSGGAERGEDPLGELEALARRTAAELPFVLVLHDGEKLWFPQQGSKAPPDGEEVELPAELRGELEALARGLRGPGEGAQRSAVYVTSRYSFVGEIHGVKKLEVGGLHGAERMKYLSRHERVAKEAKALEKLGGHPRALERLDATLRLLEERGEAKGIEELLAAELTERYEDMLLDCLVGRLGKEESRLLARLSVVEEPAPMGDLVGVLKEPGEPVCRARERLDATFPVLERLALVVRTDRQPFPGLGPERATGDERHWEMDAVTAAYLAEHFPGDVLEGHRRAGQQYEARLLRTRDVWDHLRARRHWLRAGEHRRAAEIAFAVSEAFWTWGLWREAERLMEETLGAAGGDREVEAIALHNRGVHLQDLGHIGEALRDYEQALEILRGLGDRAGEARSLHQIANVHQHRGEYAEALRLYQCSLEIKRELGDRAGEAVSLHQIGMIHRLRGEYAEALGFYERSLEIKRELGDRAGEAVSLHQIGIIHQHRGEYAEALGFYERSLDTLRELGDRAGEAVSLHQIGIIHHLRGEHAEALGFYERSLEIKRELGDRAGEAGSLHQVGIIHQHRGEYAEALGFYERSLEIERELGNRAGEAGSLHQIGIIHQLRGEYAEALGCYERSLEIHRELGDRTSEARALAQLGVLYRDRGDFRRATLCLVSSYRTLSELGAPARPFVIRHIRELQSAIGPAAFEDLLTSLAGCVKDGKRGRDPFGERES
jgi:tetratricopeptide (TPR) repeat protein